MLQAALVDCLCLGLRPFPQNGFFAAEVDVGWRYVVRALVVALVVVIVDEGPDLAFDFALTMPTGGVAGSRIKGVEMSGGHGMLSSGQANKRSVRR